MEGIPTLRDLLSPGDWFVKVDLKNAYFTVPIDPGHHQYLKFMLGKERYQFTCLLFGLSCAPRTFTKVMKPVMILLRSWGVRIIIYIDDMLILAETSEQAYQLLETLLWILQSLGFVVNREKSVFIASQEIEFLGLVINSQSMELSLPGEKLRQIKGEATKLLSQQLVSARALSQFIGKLNAAAQAITPAPLFYRHLQGNLENALTSGDQGYESMTSLSQEAQEELIWWQQHLLGWNDRCLLKGRDQLVISSDASLLGWGASCNGAQTGARGHSRRNYGISTAWRCKQPTWPFRLSWGTNQESRCSCGWTTPRQWPTSTTWGEQYPHIWPTLQNPCGCGHYRRT